MAAISQAIQPKSLGFTPTALPDRRWILNIAFTLLPNLEIFTGGNKIDDIVGIPIEFLQNNAFFDPYLKPSKRPIFLKTEETRAREKEFKLRKRLMKKERRANYLEIEGRKINEEISDLQAEIDINNNIA